MSLGDCPCIVNGQLPATAQVASQQKVIFSYTGEDEAQGLLPPEADPLHDKSLAEKIAAFAIQSDSLAASFNF